jgi:hypothetical protein
MKLAVLRANYADEFDFQGLRFFTDEQWEEFTTACEQADYPCEAYFGTNEYMEIEDLAEFQSWLTIHEVNEGLVATMRQLLGMSEYATAFGLWVDPT